jgi:DNA primase
MTREHHRIDTDAIKQAVSLVEVARQYTTLKSISQTGEQQGACPLCGGTDRFHIKDERYYCRQCYPRGGDVIDFVMRVEDVSFKEACTRLASLPSFSERPQPTMPTLPAAKRRESLSWLDAAFQQSAQKTIAATQRRLLSERGIEGQAYLTRRGFTEATWRAYRIGFGTTFHPLHGENKEAIFIPWYAPDGRTIYAIQHRFLDPSLEKSERYTMKAGSSPLLFGLQALAPAENLFIVEGEFNGMALHQVGQQAVSVGSETNRINQRALTLLHEHMISYEQVMVWFDNPVYGQQFADRLTKTMHFRKKIRVVDVLGPDANEMLVAGELAEVVETF